MKFYLDAKIDSYFEIDLDDREYKLLMMCSKYSQDPFGAPNHSLMVLVAKLFDELCAAWELVE